MVGALGVGDTAETLLLLGHRPLHNVFLEHVVRSGLLGRAPGFLGYRTHERLEAVMFVGPLGGTSLEVRNPAAYGPLARAAWELSVRPRHIVGSEEVTLPFWEAYSTFGVTPIRERREPFYVLHDGELRVRAVDRLGAATETDTDEVVLNSAEQHREDLADDPFARDPEGFRERHRRDIENGRWWVLRERRRIVFQVHIGPDNERTVQIGGVMTPAELRGRGYGSRGMSAISEQLLGQRPTVTLFCDEGNRPARSLYEKVGFHATSHFRSWLLDGDGSSG